ncbi:MAG: nucleotidyltransferase domain-containing protein [Deltaproteobacteria bacterium]|nr:nucleotidyltransferase domain-containing protein [Deltaproteobacteria bacterium]
MAITPPEKPEDIFADLAEDYIKALGSDLLSLVLFGSAASGRYQKGRSDLNLLAVVSNPAGRVLSRLAPVVTKWAPARVSAPLVMTSQYLASSLDVFPVEFLTMAASHQVIHGQDPLEGLEIKPRHLRLQLEREFKGKLMTLQSRFLMAGGQAPALEALALAALPAFTALFQAYLQLTKGAFPRDPAQVWSQVAESGLEVSAFLTLENLRQGSLKLEPADLARTLEQAAAQLAEVCRVVDKLEVAEQAKPTQSMLH